jgi:hypothetical protein
MSISLPESIEAYFAAERAEDARALARCFASDGVVHDEGGTFTGTGAIERWNAKARAKYHHTVEPLSVTDRHGTVVVLAKVAGDFPGSPVNLEHAFRLKGDKIVSLEIG